MLIPVDGTCLLFSSLEMCVCVCVCVCVCLLLLLLFFLVLVSYSMFKLKKKNPRDCVFYCIYTEIQLSCVEVMVSHSFTQHKEDSVLKNN